MARAGIVAVALALGTTLGVAAPTRPPPTPAIAPGTRTFVAFGGAPAAVRLAWAAAQNVARYRARWTDAGAAIDVELPGTATAFEREERTPGMHQLSVVAIDAEGRESAPVEIAVEVVTVTAFAPGAREPTRPVFSDDDDDGKRGTNAFAVGARFLSPGLTCQLNDGPRGAEVTASSAGMFTLRCGGDPGQPRVDVPLVIAPVLVHSEVRQLVAGRTSRVHVTLASVAPIGPEIEIEAFGEVELGEPERTSGGLDVPVTARATGGLILRAGAFELGRVALPVVTAAAAAGSVRTIRTITHSRGTDEPAWGAFDVGGYVGIFVPPTIGLGANAIGVPRRPDDVVGTAPILAVHAGWFPTRRAGLEAELGLGTPGYVNSEGISAIAVGRIQLAARAIEDRSYGLRVIAGADVISTLTERSTSRRDATGGVHAGLAFSVETRAQLWLRVQGLDVIVPARDGGYAHCAELSIGVVTRLGRQDRW
jgi:hypothetical protein